MSLYDYPHYYDLVFGSDWKAELDFLQQCFAKHGRRSMRRVFEPACGTGRLLVRLGRAGYQVYGLDLNPRAVAYCNERLQRYGLPQSARVGDMTRFRLPQRMDACFNMISSFQHLPSDEAAASHLDSVSKCLVRGGLYILGFHLSPTAAQPTDGEAWSARRGHLQINTRVRAIERNRRRRAERFEMVCDVYTPCQVRRLEEQLLFRSYTHVQFRRLLKQIPTLHQVATYDFRYQISQEIEADSSTEDVVYVLQKE